MDNTLTTKIVGALLALFLVLTVVGQFFVKSGNDLKIEVAMRYNSQDTIDFIGVFARDEHTVSRVTSGVLLYEHEDGSKVGKNSIIANTFASRADIEYSREIDVLEKKIATLKDAQALAGTDNSQVEAFGKLITEKHSELTDAVQNGDYALVSQLKYELLNLQCKRDMVKGKVSDYSAVIKKYENEISSLEDRISASPVAITADETGYFVSSADGYENILTAENAAMLTPSQIKDIIENPVKEKPQGNVIGKMIEGYEWKLAAVFTQSQAAVLTQNTYVELIAGADLSRMTVLVESVEKHGDEYVAVFSADELNSVLASSRTGKFKLLIDSYNGIRIPSTAVHFDDQNNVGVYIKDGTQARFRFIERIYSAEDYIIVSDTSGKDGYLSLYDSVIVEGKDLYDGKTL